MEEYMQILKDAALECARNYLILRYQHERGLNGINEYDVMWLYCDTKLYCRDGEFNLDEIISEAFKGIAPS